MHDLNQDHTVEQNTCGTFIVREDTVQWNSPAMFAKFKVNHFTLKHLVHIFCDFNVILDFTHDFILCYFFKFDSSHC